MTDFDCGLTSLRALTVNHQNVGIQSLGRLSSGCEGVMKLHHALTASGTESFVLATCNRSEIYWRARGGDDVNRVRRQFEDTLRAGTPGAPGLAAALMGREAAHHLFRVCSGLESLILGEAEILGQVRAAHATCAGAGRFLHGVVQGALRAGRMARADTAIGVGALSVASAATQLLAGSISLPHSRVLVVGAGDTGLKAARHLRGLGVRELVIANRTLARAETLAQLVSAEATGLEALTVELNRADAVVCAVGASMPVIRSADLARAADLRGGRAMVVVDLGMPPGVEPGDVAGVSRIDLAGLREEVAEQRRRRAAEVPKVEAIIARELDRLEAWLRHQTLRPLVSDLRRKVEAIRRTELARAQAELPGGSLHGDVLDRLSRRLLEQVIALPLATLASCDVPLDAAQAVYLRRLFALDEVVPRWP